jgi:hypothetical protein
MDLFRISYDKFVNKKLAYDFNIAGQHAYQIPVSHLQHQCPSPKTYLVLMSRRNTTKVGPKDKTSMYILMGWVYCNNLHIIF